MNKSSSFSQLNSIIRQNTWRCFSFNMKYICNKGKVNEAVSIKTSLLKKKVKWMKHLTVWSVGLKSIVICGSIDKDSRCQCLNVIWFRWQIQISFEGKTISFCAWSWLPLDAYMKVLVYSISGFRNFVNIIQIS